MSIGIINNEYRFPTPIIVGDIWKQVMPSKYGWVGVFYADDVKYYFSLKYRIEDIRHAVLYSRVYDKELMFPYFKMTCTFNNESWLSARIFAYSEDDFLYKEGILL